MIFFPKPENQSKVTNSDMIRSIKRLLTYSFPNLQNILFCWKKNWFKKIFTSFCNSSKISTQAQLSAEKVNRYMQLFTGILKVRSFVVILGDIILHILSLLMIAFNIHYQFIFLLQPIKHPLHWSCGVCTASLNVFLQMAYYFQHETFAP